MQKIDPNDFRIKPLQIFLYAIVAGGIMFLCLMNGFNLLSASLMTLGIMLALILFEYLFVGYLEKRQEDREWDEQHGINK